MTSLEHLLTYSITSTFSFLFQHDQGQVIIYLLLPDMLHNIINHRLLDCLGGGAISGSADHLAQAPQPIELSLVSPSDVLDGKANIKILQVKWHRNNPNFWVIFPLNTVQ